MRRHFMLGTVFSAALAVGAYAQSAGQSPTGQQDASKSSRYLRRRLQSLDV